MSPVEKPDEQAASEERQWTDIYNDLHAAVASAEPEVAKSLQTIVELSTIKHLLERRIALKKDHGKLVLVTGVLVAILLGPFAPTWSSALFRAVVAILVALLACFWPFESPLVISRTALFLDKVPGLHSLAADLMQVAIFPKGTVGRSRIRRRPS